MLGGYRRLACRAAGTLKYPQSRLLATQDSSAAHQFSDTLNLPNTSFPNRSSPELISSTILPQTTTDLYKWNSERETSKDNLFILHDGPPYANGELHLGHSLNKILKDIINRYQLMRGKKVFYRPGWDCHGLPIELKLLENLNQIKNKKEKLLKKQIKKCSNDQERLTLELELHALKSNKLSPLEIRRLASQHADNAVQLQKLGFKKIGVMGDWDQPYLTKNKQYVVNQLKIFKKLFDRGLIQRQNKPVYWGCENASALAEGELEYNENHKSTLIYVKFPVVKSEVLLDLLRTHEVSLLIWTSTPWTIPSNKLISINRDLVYSVVKSQEHGFLVVAQDLIPSLLKIDPSLEEIRSVEGSVLANDGLQYSSPLLEDDQVFPVLAADHVTNSAGTGLVHTAPGHGHDDYFVCLKHGIKTYSPVDDYGRYTAELPQSLHLDLLHKKVLSDGNKIVISKLKSHAMLFHESEYTHSYPYDWRSKKPIIIRSTPQWFINVDKIKADTIAALDSVGFYPERGSKRLVSFIRTRNEWCISRQRSWGVPIPVLYHKLSGEPLLTDASIDKIIGVVSEEGPDEWFNGDQDVSRWLPSELSLDSHSYVKGTDTMDVWFDSGTSWTVVEEYLQLQDIPQRDFLADVYLEGSDQHRGWFQSSLLTKIAVDRAVVPYRKIITHGFTLDERGVKMSKSIGNTISVDLVLEGDPSKKLPRLGIDGLRLWVAQLDYSTDISVGPTVLSRVGDNLKKIRFTLKFLLGNLPQNEFQEVLYEELSPLDRYVLSHLAKTELLIDHAFQEFNFSKIIRELNLNMNVLLSSIYFDISKDVLYTDRADSKRRRAIQTVLLQVYRTYVTILAPILPIITQEAWNHTPQYLKRASPSESPFHEGWQMLPSHYIDSKLDSEFELIWELRDKVKMLLDRGNRVDKLIKNSLETLVFVDVEGGNSSVKEILLRHQDHLNDYFLTSQVVLGDAAAVESADFIYSDEFELDGCKIVVKLAKSRFHKCPRCWKFDSKQEDSLCLRCEDAVVEQAC